MEDPFYDFSNKEIYTILNPMGEQIFYNALNVVTDRNYTKLAKLRSVHPSWERAWENLEPHVRGGVSPQKEWEGLLREDIRLILFDDIEYPPLLREIPYPPFGIYVRGPLPQKETLTLAVVGTRKATEEGMSLARTFASDLAKTGITIVSGLALGIDAAAHRGALEGDGKTLAVLGGGLDRCYPRTNEALAKKILSRGGALISEYPVGSPSFPHRFLERNRIVSGLSRGVLIIEAPAASGALATARFATEQNRDVFVTPGPATHPHFKGSHALIRIGAMLVTEPSQILEAWGLASHEKDALQNLFSLPEEQTIVEAFKKSGRALSVDKIIELTTLNAQTVNRIVTCLLIQGKVKESGEGYTLA